MGSKFGRFVSCFFTFLCGYAIGFGYCWQMTLVMMTMLPMVMISGGIIAQVDNTIKPTDEPTRPIINSPTERPNHQ